MSGIAYHAWTHRPKALGGTDPVASLIWPWVALVNSGMTLAGDNAAHKSLLIETYWDPSITGDPQVGGGVFFIESVDDGEGNDYWQLTLNKEGWYDFEIVHALDEATSNGGANVFFMHELVWAGGAFSEDTPIGYAAPWTATGPELAITPYISTFRRLWISSGEQAVDLTVRQNSAAAKGVTGHLKVWYLGGLGGGTDNVGWDVAVI